MKKDFIRFSKALIVIIIALVTLDFAVGKSLAYLYNHQRSKLFYLANYAMDSTRADYIIVGSSRANHHYNVKVLEDKLNASVYNCGRDGTEIIYSCALISRITERYKPKCIVIDVNDLNHTEEGKLSVLLPYHHYPSIKPYIKYQGPFQQLKLTSQIYPYNSLFTSLLSGIKPDRHPEDYKGYIPLKRQIENTPVKPMPDDGTLNKDKLEVLDATLKNLQAKNIAVYLIFSPIYANIQSTNTANFFNSLTNKYSNCKFLNYINSPIYTKAEYFSDVVHLNEKGATLFSAEIAEKIKSRFPLTHEN